MRALVLLSHGSRLEASNQEMMELGQRMADISHQPFDKIQCAFQQFAQPAFETVMEELARNGTRDVVVCPLFLSSGNHVRVDLPEMIAKAAGRYPDIKISLTPHIGGLKGLDRFLLEQVLAHAAAD